MTARKRQRAGKEKVSAGKPVCPSCGAQILAEASFCHACGATLTEEAPSTRWPAGTLAIVGTAVVLSAAAGAVALVVLSEDDGAPLPAPTQNLPDFQQSAAASPGTPPDLSQMTPREMADRLFNRVMMASEQGDRAEALKFAPMAIQAYGNLPALDRDARYHLALLHGVTGDDAAVEEQIAALKEGAPDHLLALILEHRRAKKAGDLEAAVRLRADFTAAYEREMAAGRPEYQGHRNVIEGFRGGPASPTAASVTTASPVEADGATLFAANCGGCHGADATGTEQGPPLVHEIYEPSHHADAAFYKAVRQGVEAHHWSFGDMPPAPWVDDDETAKMIAYVRELQRAAGIE